MHYKYKNDNKINNDEYELGFLTFEWIGIKVQLSMIAHNMPIGIGMLEKEGFVSKIKIIDTLRVAKHLLAEQPSKALQ